MCTLDAQTEKSMVLLCWQKCSWQLKCRRPLKYHRHNYLLWRCSYWFNSYKNEMQENKRQLEVADFPQGWPRGCGSLGGGELSFFFFFLHLKNFLLWNNFRLTEDLQRLLRGFPCHLPPSFFLLMSTSCSTEYNDQETITDIAHVSGYGLCSDVISFAPNVLSLSQGSTLLLIVISPSLVGDSFAVSPFPLWPWSFFFF